MTKIKILKQDSSTIKKLNKVINLMEELKVSVYAAPYDRGMIYSVDGITFKSMWDNQSSDTFPPDIGDKYVLCNNDGDIITTN